MFISFLRSCQTTRDLKSSQYQELLKSLKIDWEKSLVLSPFLKNQTLVLIIKYCAKVEISVFCSCPVLLDIITFTFNLHYSKYFFQTSGSEVITTEKTKTISNVNTNWVCRSKCIISKLSTLIIAYLFDRTSSLQQNRAFYRNLNIF